MINLKKGLFLLLAILLLTACQSSKQAQSDTNQLENKPVKMAVTTELSQQIWKDTAKRLKTKDNIDLDVQLITDWVQPDLALDQGDIDFNSFQFLPFLADFNQSHKTNLVPLAFAYIPPTCLYAHETIPSLDAIPKNSKITIPDDPVNLDHCLKELEKIHLIQLDPKHKGPFGLEDISDNPKDLQFLPMKGATLARSFDDTDLMITAASSAHDAGISQKRAIYVEDTNKTPDIYKVSIVTKAERRNDPTLQKIIKEFQSPETAQFIEKVSAGSYVAAWNAKDQPEAAYKAYMDTMPKK